MTTESIAANVVDALNWRYATKKFDPSKKISDAIWQQIERGLLLTPSSYGLQPWKFVVITDPNIKKQLPAASYNQPQPETCSHLVVFCRLSKLDEQHVNDYVARISEVRGVPLDSLNSFKKVLMDFVGSTPQDRLEDWMARQCYIALGNLMSIASQFKVDNCPMEGLDREEYDRILDLPAKGCRSVVMCALGYRAEDDKYAKLAKVRFDSSRVIVRI